MRDPAILDGERMKVELVGKLGEIVARRIVRVYPNDLMRFAAQVADEIRVAHRRELFGLGVEYESFEHRLPVVGCRLSVVGCRLPVAGCRLSVVGCRLSVVGCRLPVVGCRLPVAGCRLPVVSEKVIDSYRTVRVIGGFVG